MIKYKLETAVNSAYFIGKNFNEFGLPWRRDTLWHKVGDIFVLSYEGVRIAELIDDTTLRLLLPKKGGVPPSWKTRWGMLFSTHHVVFDVKYKRRVSGLGSHEMVITLVDRTENRKPKCITLGNAEATQAFKLTFKHGQTELVADDHEVAVAQKDNAKYRAFNAHLKKLRAVIVTQIRMDVFQAYETDQSSYYASTKAFKDDFRQRFGDSYIVNDKRRRMIREAVDKWMDNPHQRLVTDMVLLALSMHRSTKTGKTDLEQRVSNAFKSVREHYLREHCVKIEVSNNSLRPLSDDSNDQNSQLLPPDRLREVQVSGEAKVC